MAGGPATLGIDFGTSNSAAGINVSGAPLLLPLEANETTLPSAVFFDFDEKEIVFGRAAQYALVSGDEGRYMRALKSLLGTPLMRESRMLLGKRTDFIGIVGSFLAEVKRRAEVGAGHQFTHALSGRPVRFHSADDARNAQALVDLRDCYAAAGFEDVRFMPEPEAAALANRDALQSGDLGLIVDIGGGTSDFTLFRQEGDDAIQILGSHGIRLGGTDFDRTLSFEHVMPHFGLGQQIKHAFGDKTHEAPVSIFADLATWQKIPFLYTRETRKAAEDLARYAASPEVLARLVRVLEEELGHDVAFAVEAGKIAANDPAATAPPRIDLGIVERGLEVPLPAALLAATLAEMAGEIAQAGRKTVMAAGHDTASVDRVIFVGGSSLLNVVQNAMRNVFPEAEYHHGAALTAIADGLALASAQAFA